MLRKPSLTSNDQPPPPPLLCTRLATVSAIAIGICLLIPGVGAATPVTYSEVATVSGTLAGQNFVSNMITLTGTGDTANAVNNVNIARNLLTALTFSISGVGSGTFTDSIQAASNHNVPSGGFGDNTNNSGVLFTENSVFSTYNLTTSIGPVSGMADFSPGTNFPTTAGALDIAFVFGDATFSAVVPSSVTPLPAALPLFATGIGGLGLLGWRRKRKSRAGVA